MLLRTSNGQAMSSEDPKISEHHSATFTEYILLPRKTGSGQGISEVSLEARLSDDFTMNIPFMSAAMESVSGDQMAIALALHGGLCVLPAGRVEAPDQVRQIKMVKSYRDGFESDVVAFWPDLTLGKVDALQDRHGYSCFPLLDEGGRLLGEISIIDYHPVKDSDLPARKRMRSKDQLLTFPPSLSRDDIVEMLLNSREKRGYSLDVDGKLVEMVFRSGLSRELRYPQANRDKHGRLRVAAAISTHPEDRERARLCVEAGADILSIDASDGFSDYMAETIREVSKLGVPVVAGNVVDQQGFEFLAKCGADAVKIGIGSGSICTTRRVKAIGRGQATALRLVAQARDFWFKLTGKYIPLISDGGLSGTGNMAVALAMGADVLMMGKYFAGFHESPTVPYAKKFPVISSSGKAEVSATVKPYWGEASARAKNVRRYQQNDPRTFVIEGEEGYVLSKGSLHDVLPTDLKAIKGTLSSCGCSNLQEFRNDVMLERQTPGSQLEGGISILQG